LCISKSYAVVVINWFHVLDVGSFTKGFDALVSEWDRCLSSCGQYVEKCACLHSVCVNKICSYYYYMQCHTGNCTFRTSEILDYSKMGCILLLLWQLNHLSSWMQR
jgi:hypothetical protein